MKSPNWKDVAELIGISAILIGMYFVYEEIRLIGTIARAEMSAESNRELSELRQRRLDPDFAEIYIKSIESPEELSRTERLQINSYLQLVLEIYRRECYYRAIGIFRDCDSFPRYTAVEFFGGTYGRAFLQTVGNRMVGPRITAVINQQLVDTPIDDSYRQIDESVLENLPEQ